VITLMMDYAGPDQWLFLGGVCKAWAAVLAPPRQTRRSARAPAARALRTTTTSFAAAAASLRRALYACQCDTSLAHSWKLLALSKAAAACGCSEVLLWTRAAAEGRWRNRELSDQLCAAAVGGNQIAIMQLLRDDAELYVHAISLTEAAAGCKGAQLATLQWAYSQCPPWAAEFMTNFCVAAAAADATDKLAWLYSTARSCAAPLQELSIVSAGVDAGSLNALRWLASAGVELNSMQYTDRASIAAQFSVLRYLVTEAGCPWNVRLAEKRAAEVGTVDDLQWIAEHSSSVWPASVLSELLMIAGVNDKLATAVWLREQGAEWPPSFALPNTLIETPVPWLRRPSKCWSTRAMQWALANGCTWGATRVECPPGGWGGSRAAWAHAIGCPCDCNGSALTAGLRSYCTSLQLCVQQQLQQRQGSAATFDFNSYSRPALQSQQQQHRQRATTAVAAAARYRQQRRGHFAAASAVAELWHGERQQHRKHAKLLAMAAVAAVQQRELQRTQRANTASAAVAAARFREQQQPQQRIAATAAAAGAAIAAAAAVAQRREQQLALCVSMVATAATEAQCREQRRAVLLGAAAQQRPQPAHTQRATAAAAAAAAAEAEATEAQQQPAVQRTTIVLLVTVLVVAAAVVVTLLCTASAGQQPRGSLQQDLKMIELYLQNGDSENGLKLLRGVLQRGV
jgi:hypothetical protein